MAEYLCLMNRRVTVSDSKDTSEPPQRERSEADASRPREHIWHWRGDWSRRLGNVPNTYHFVYT